LQQPSISRNAAPKSLPIPQCRHSGHIRKSLGFEEWTEQRRRELRENELAPAAENPEQERDIHELQNAASSDGGAEFLAGGNLQLENELAGRHEQEEYSYDLQNAASSDREAGSQAGANLQSFNASALRNIQTATQTN
jgi:hypothetical protein